MRRRDIRAARRQAQAGDWPPANDEIVEPDPEGDEYWRDAIAGQDDTPPSVDAAGTYTD